MFKMKQPMLAILLILYALPHTSYGQKYICGGVNSDPVVVPGDGTGSSFIRKLQKSAASTLCVLLRITSPRGASLDDITRTSDIADYDVVPVARSVDGDDWKRVAGPYAQKLEVFNCDGNPTCRVRIPVLPNLETGKFILMSFEHSISDRAKVSRFFHQTTFGPTLDMINSFDYSDPANLEDAMASWVHDQMLNVPMTSHRAYFRERADFHLMEEKEGQNAFHQNYKVRSPCDKGSRWTEYSFTTDDYSTNTNSISVSYYNGNFLIMVDNVPRTVVTEWKDADTGNALRVGGWWGFCWYTEEYLGGEIRFYDSSARKCFKLKGGNPQMNLPFAHNSITQINLPARSNFGYTPKRVGGLYYLPFFKYGETLDLKTAVPKSECTSRGIDYRNSKNIIGKLANSNTQLRYARYIELDENTLENPNPSGGGELKALGGICGNPDQNFLNAATCSMSTEANVCSAAWNKKNPGDAVMVCGSPNEVANLSPGNSTFINAWISNVKHEIEYTQQKKNAWTMATLEAGDQLRQRVAWALSQILVITPNQIGKPEYSEPYMNYYDIFVRHAFGNYFDILKEVSFSPMMGEMLSFFDSKSRSFMLKEEDVIAFPDENYAREVMQLFTMGLVEKNMDGTLKLDDNGLAIPTYDNSDIQNFARAWTGFTGQNGRSNIEMYYNERNQIDPMRVEGPWRDPYPKTAVDGSYIGDKFPLCVDNPPQAFLRKGATYRLVGSSTIATLRYQPWFWRRGDLDDIMKRFPLDQNSALFSKLCNGSPGNCNFQPVVTLDENIGCDPSHPECSLDDLRLVQVQSNPVVNYEYIRPACVEFAFYDTGKTIQHQRPQTAMCANGDLPLAKDTCCGDPFSSNAAGGSWCAYTGEQTSFETSRQRCLANVNFPIGDVCHWTRMDFRNLNCHYWGEDDWYWTGERPCALQAKVTSSGTVAIVHNPYIPNGSTYTVDMNAGVDNTNFFKVSWDNNGFPDPSNACANSGCTYYNGVECLCDVTIEEVPVFTSIPSISDITSTLHVGGVDVARFDGEYTELESGGGVTVWQKNGAGYNIDTVFVADGAYYKNMRSDVKIDNSQYSFRNPPNFVNPALREPRDAEYETEEVLKQYFRNSNVAPFLAERLIQRFGVSNPSPDYIESAATAFATGSFSYAGLDFGAGEYGDLGAMVAAIVLNDEARNPLIDADPTSGSLREPLIKLLSFMRAMNFEKHTNAPELTLLDLEESIGQMAHACPNVFSFFLPEYKAPGHIKAASITSPEAQVMTSQKVVSMLNGMFSLVEIGLTDCFGGFGQLTHLCDGFVNGNYDPEEFNRGFLRFDSSSTVASQVVDELSLLLTGGRLHPEAKNVIVGAYQNASPEDKFKIAQKLITATPEFHASGIFYAKASPRPTIVAPPPSDEEYKAVVFVNLFGGADSYNMLVPHSGCTGKDMYQEYAGVRRNLALAQNSLLQIDASSSNQICSTFGLNNNLRHLWDLYNQEDLLWISNMGILQEYATNDDWLKKHGETRLFAHNIQQEEVQNMDIYEDQVGRGVAGRMVDILLKDGFRADLVSANGIAEALVAAETSQIVIDSGNYEKFDPISDFSNYPDVIRDHVKELNSAANLGSSLFSETWASLLHQSLHENELLYDALKDVTLDTEFTQEYWLSRQLETVAKMMKTKDVRGSDRDIYYVEFGSFDTHASLNELFDGLTAQLNEGILEFTTEMKAQGKWDSVTVVMVSEFGRTLTSNSGAGSDHAWGGNYFVAGGSVAGKKILGEYPDSLTNGPYIFQPGIVIPTTPWESLWHGVAQWMGIINPTDLREVVPNMKSFPDEDMFTTVELYGYSPPPVTPSPTRAPSPAPFTETPTRAPVKDPTDAPVKPPTKAPVKDPTDAPTTTASAHPTLVVPTCTDSLLKVLTGKTKKTAKTCQAISKKTGKFCVMKKVQTHCPKTCGYCNDFATSDSIGKFLYDSNVRDCKWVRGKFRTSSSSFLTLCQKDEISTTCREACTFCAGNDEF